MIKTTQKSAGQYLLDAERQVYLVSLGKIAANHVLLATWSWQIKNGLYDITVIDILTEFRDMSTFINNSLSQSSEIRNSTDEGDRISHTEIKQVYVQYTSRIMLKVRVFWHVIFWNRPIPPIMLRVT